MSIENLTPEAKRELLAAIINEVYRLVVESGEEVQNAASSNLRTKNFNFDIYPFTKGYNTFKGWRVNGDLRGAGMGVSKPWFVATSAADVTEKFQTRILSKLEAAKVVKDEKRRQTQEWEAAEEVSRTKDFADFEKNTGIKLDENKQGWSNDRFEVELSSEIKLEIEYKPSPKGGTWSISMNKTWGLDTERATKAISLLTNEFGKAVRV
jgi:hypothetical protein